MLTKIMITPFNRSESWAFLATKYNGTIYLRQIETEQEHQQHLNETDRDKLMCYWGHKFEDYMTTSSESYSNVVMSSLHHYYDVIITSLIAAPATIRDTSNGSGDPVNPNMEFTTVARTRINSHSIVMGAEIDCCDHVSRKSCDHTCNMFPQGSKEQSPRNYIELKTSRFILTDRNKYSFKK